MVDAPAEILERFFRERPELGVAAAYLFGSRNEGRAHRESDIDVAVLLDWRRYPRLRDRFDARLRLGADLIHALGHNEVDLVILNDAPPLFGRSIVWQGSRVFVGDPQAAHDYVRDVQLRAADLAPFLEKMRRIKLEALARRPGARGEGSDAEAEVGTRAKIGAAAVCFPQLGALQRPESRSRRPGTLRKLPKPAGNDPEPLGASRTVR